MEKEELQEKIVHPEIVAEVEKKMLSESEFEDLALLFKMFADSTRLKVLKALFEREMCGCAAQDDTFCRFASARFTQENPAGAQPQGWQSGVLLAG